MLRFRGRDPSEAAAHRQKRGGCLAGQHFGPGVKFILHRRLERTLYVLNTKNKHANYSKGCLWGGETGLFVYREFNRENMEAALIICSAAPRSYLHYLVLLTQPKGELTLTQPLQEAFFQSFPPVEFKVEL